MNCWAAFFFAAQECHDEGKTSTTEDFFAKINQFVHF
jgi:hypothetical protein